MENLRSLRKNAGLTQKELASKLGVTHASISLWEAGIQYPSADKLPALAKALGCRIDDLYANEEVKEAV